MYIIRTDSDPFRPGKPLFTPTQLDEIARKFSAAQSPSQPGRPVADIINNDEPAPAPVVKTERVAAPEKKIVHGTLVIKRVKKEKSK
jgi:hypothetical protein